MQLSRSHSGTAGPRQPQRMPQAHSLLLSCRSRCAPALTRTNPARLITRAASPDTLDQAAVSERQQSAKNASSSKGADDFHDWRQHITEVMQGLADADSAVTLTCKGKISAAQEWRQVIVRPVDLKAGRQLQVRLRIVWDYSAAQSDANRPGHSFETPSVQAAGVSSAASHTRARSSATLAPSRTSSRTHPLHLMTRLHACTSCCTSCPGAACHSSQPLRCVGQSRCKICTVSLLCSVTVQSAHVPASKPPAAKYRPRFHIHG